MNNAVFALLLVSTTASAVRYTFTPQACESGNFSSYESSNSNNTRLRVPVGHTLQCAPSLGVRSNSLLGAGIVSEWPLEFLVAPSNDGISFELWLNPGKSFSEQPILTVGQRSNLVVEPVLQNSTSNTNNGTLSPCDAGKYDFQLAMAGKDAWTATYRLSDDPFEPCRTLTFGNVTPDELALVVVSLSSDSQAVYLNGRVAVVAEDPFNASLWNMKDHRLHLLGYQNFFSTDIATASTSPATLYRLAVRSSPLAEVDVQRILQQGLPSTPPFAFDQNVTINEDAENAPGSHSIQWYRTATSPADAAHFAGPMVGSIDRDVQALIAKSLLVSNTTFSLPVFAPIYVYITSLPDTGNLYLAGGSALSSARQDSSIFVPIGVEPVQSLVYIPPHNVHSAGEFDPVSSFRYCISATAIFHASQCESSATAYVSVASVNDPPIALAVPKTTVAEGIELVRAPKMSLLGLDVDVGDSIQQVQIVRPPAYGDLILAITTFRKDLLPHGTLLSSLNNTVRGDDPVHVKYVWRPNAHVPRVIQGKMITDSFTYRVRDESGLWSCEEKVEVQIVSAVTAEVDPFILIDEDAKRNLLWRGLDSSGYNRRLGFFVDKVPSPEVGTLVDTTTNEPLSVGKTVHAFSNFPYESGVFVSFQPAPNFCHDRDAQLAYDAEIRFRVAAYVGDAVVSVSDSVSQKIIVACVLDVISMSVPEALVTVFETSLDRTNSEPCHAALFDAIVETTPCEAVAIINGIASTSIDRKADRAFVTVSSKSGFLTFNGIYWNRTEPVVGRRVLAAGRISFYAYPDDLSNILAGLRFQSHSAGNDSIDFELLYGSCTTLEVGRTPGSFKTSSCQVIRRSIAVKILRDNDKYKSETRIVVGFPWHILFCLIVYPALYGAVFLLNSSIAGDDDEDTIVEGSPLEPVERFVQHEDANGMFYYEDTLDRTTRWDLPPGEDFVRGDEIDQ